MLWRLAWRNLWRNPRRTLLTTAIIGMGLSLLIFLICYLEGMTEKLGDQLARSSIGHLQIHHPQYLSQHQVDMLVPEAKATVAGIEELPGIWGVRPRLSLTASIRSSTSSTVRVVPLLGVDRAHEIGVSRTADHIVSGEYVVPPTEAVAPHAPSRHRLRRGITLGDKLAELLRVELGSKVRLDMSCLNGATCSTARWVTGIVDTGSDTADQAIAIVDLAGLQEVLGVGDQVHEISVLLRDAGDISGVIDSIKANLADVHVPLRQLELSWVDEITEEAGEKGESRAALAVEPWWELNPDIKAMLGMMDMASGFMYALMLILMSSGILTTMFTVVYERKRELGIQAALGTSPWRIFAGSVAEAIWLALIGVAFGTAVGAVWAWLMTTYGIDLSGMSGSMSAGGLDIGNRLVGKMNVRVFTEPALVVFISTIIFSLLPSLKMARMKPIEAMADKG